MTVSLKNVRIIINFFCLFIDPAVIQDIPVSKATDVFVPPTIIPVLVSPSYSTIESTYKIRLQPSSQAIPRISTIQDEITTITRFQMFSSLRFKRKSSFGIISSTEKPSQLFSRTTEKSSEMIFTTSSLMDLESLTKVTSITRLPLLYISSLSITGESLFTQISVRKSQFTTINEDLMSTPTFSQEVMQSSAKPSFSRPVLQSDVTPSFSRLVMQSDITPSFSRLVMQSDVTPSFSRLVMQSDVTPSFSRPVLQSDVTPSFSPPVLKSDVKPSFPWPKMQSSAVLTNTTSNPRKGCGENPLCIVGVVLGVLSFLVVFGIVAFYLARKRYELNFLDICCVHNLQYK